MHFNSRRGDSQPILHADDKKWLSGAKSVIGVLKKFDDKPLDEPDAEDDDFLVRLDDLYVALAALCRRYGVVGTEHLSKTQKADVATGSVPGPPKGGGKAPY